MVAGSLLTRKGCLLRFYQNLKKEERGSSRSLVSNRPINRFLVFYRRSNLYKNDEAVLWDDNRVGYVTEFEYGGRD